MNRSPNYLTNRLVLAYCIAIGFTLTVNAASRSEMDDDPEKTSAGTGKGNIVAQELNSQKMLKARVIAPNTISLNWTGGGNDVAGYSIYRDDKWVGQSKKGEFVDRTVVFNDSEFNYRVYSYTKEKVYAEIGTVKIIPRHVGLLDNKTPSYGADTHSIDCPQESINPADYGAFPDDDEDDTLALRDAIVNASNGSTLCFQPGIYTINNALDFESNISMIGNGSTIQGMKDDSIPSILFQSVENVHLSNITLDTVLLDFRSKLGWSNNYQRSTKNITIDHITMINGFYSSPSLNYHIKMNRAQNVEISNSLFKRSQGNAGRSINLWKNADVVIRDSKWEGDFVTAININGANENNQGVIIDGERSQNITIANNSISRRSSYYPEDHGIYLWGIDIATIESNEIQGWSATSEGGSIKIANSQNYVIKDNYLKNSGIYIYTYESIVPRHSRNVYTENNVIDIRNDLLNGRTKYAGFLYWRNFSDHDNAETQCVVSHSTILGGGVNLQPPNNFEAFVLDNVCADSAIIPGEVDVDVASCR